MAPRDSGKEERFIQFLVACHQDLDDFSTHIGTNVSYRRFKMGNTFASLPDTQRKYGECTGIEQGSF